MSYVDLAKVSSDIISKSESALTVRRARRTNERDNIKGKVIH